MKRLLTSSLLCVLFVVILVFPSTAFGKSFSLNWGYDSNCPGNNTPKVEIGSKNYGVYNTLCLWGNGYQGLGDPGGPGNQSNVFSVAAFHTVAWIRYYDGSGGHFCSFNWDTAYFNYVYVTQVDVGSTGGYSYCPV